MDHPKNNVAIQKKEVISTQRGDVSSKQYLASGQKESFESAYKGLLNAYLVANPESNFFRWRHSMMTSGLDISIIRSI